MRDARLIVSKAADNSVVLKSSQELGDYPTSLGEMLLRAVEQQPERKFLLERDDKDEWRSITYAETWATVRCLAQALINYHCNIKHPLMILSANSTEHALISLAAIIAGIPVVPVSPAYSLASTDFIKLKFIVKQIQPALIFVQSIRPFEQALSSLDLDKTKIIAANTHSELFNSINWQSLLDTKPTKTVDKAFHSLTPSSVAKYLFSSGSTGMPKAVINTHRMLCSNQQALLQIHPFLSEEPPVIVDWLPWNHTFGGNHNFNMIIRNAGSLYIDKGKPLNKLFDESVKNLSEVAPTVYFNVPAGFDMLTRHLQDNAILRKNFFSCLKLIYYAAAALPQSIFERLNELSYQELGRYVPITTGYGSTETGPLATTPASELKNAIGIGIPIPGTELKLAPVGDKLEVRVKGPNVTNGYLDDAEKTSKAFDEDGFFRMGDAADFIDPGNPSDGLYFNGRIAEDFKLLSGIWVSVGNVRVSVISATTPLVKDLVITGHDRGYIGALIWLNADACRQLCEKQGSPESLVIGNPIVISKLRSYIESYNIQNSGSSVRIARAMIMSTPLSVDKNEITDKGYINQSAVLLHRSNLVEQLYSENPGPEVLEF